MSSSYFFIGFTFLEVLYEYDRFSKFRRNVAYATVAKKSAQERQYDDELEAGGRHFRAVINKAEQRSVSISFSDVKSAGALESWKIGIMANGGSLGFTNLEALASSEDLGVRIAAGDLGTLKALNYLARSCVNHEKLMIVGDDLYAAQAVADVVAEKLSFLGHPVDGPKRITMIKHDSDLSR